MERKLTKTSVRTTDTKRGRRDVAARISTVGVSVNQDSLRALAIRNLKTEIRMNPERTKELIATQLWVAKHFGDAELERLVNEVEPSLDSKRG